MSGIFAGEWERSPKWSGCLGASFLPTSAGKVQSLVCARRWEDSIRVHRGAHALDSLGAVGGPRESRQFKARNRCSKLHRGGDHRPQYRSQLKDPLWAREDSGRAHRRIPATDFPRSFSAPRQNPDRIHPTGQKGVHIGSGHRCQKTPMRVEPGRR